MPTKTEAAPTQQLIELETIQQDAIILRNGGLRKIVMVTGLNFDLKSEEEQTLTLYAFQNFLNGLNYSVQLFIHSRKINIEPYLTTLAARRQEEPMAILQNIIGEYREFIRSFTSQNAIMEKRFFAVVPYDPIQLPAAGRTALRRLLGLFGKKPPPAEQDAAARQREFSRRLQQLDQRVDQVISGLTQVGVRAVPLNEEEITELFYNLYNPETTGTSKNLELESPHD